MRIPPHWEMKPFPLHCVQSNTVFPVKDIRTLDLLDGTPDSPQEHCQKTRRTLMSPQECKVARCTPNHLKMNPISPAWAP